MPRRTDPRITFQNLIARYAALHADLTAQAKSRNAGAAGAQVVRRVRALLADTKRHLDSAPEAGALPFAPKNGAVAPSDLALLLGEARAVLEAHGKVHRHDQPPVHERLSKEEAKEGLLRWAELAVLGVEAGVERRMAAIAAGEDPEEAYTVFHTEFYHILLRRHPETAEEMDREVPRLATHGDRRIAP